MKSKESDFLQKAKNYSFLLLKFSPRSEKELYESFKKKKFDETLIKEVIHFLKEKGLIDDNRFAQDWIESRIKKRLGLKRLRQELRQKGIDSGIIEANIEKIRNNYSEEEIVLKVAEEQLNKLKSIDLQKAKGRIYGYLIRRGFSPEAINDAINKLVNSM